MLGQFFSPKSTWKTMVQAYNLLVVTVAVHELATNPKASQAELGADILVHCMNILSLQDNASRLQTFATSLLNAARLGAIYSNVTEGCSSLSNAANALEAANHLGSIFALLVASTDEDEENKALAQYVKGP